MPLAPKSVAPKPGWMPNWLGNLLDQTSVNPVGTAIDTKAVGTAIKTPLQKALGAGMDYVSDSRMGELMKRFGGTREPIKAYHGSPHDFDRFSMANVGTGEGHQSYGHGLYFAENEKTANFYKRTLSKDTAPFSYDGRNVFPSSVHPFERAAYEVQKAGGDHAKVLADLQRYQASAGDSTKHFIDRVAQHVPSIEPAKFGATVPGHMYEVGIDADPKTLLNWDHPMGAQATGQRVIAQTPPAFRDSLEEFLEQHGQYGDLPDYKGGEFYQILRKFASEGELPNVYSLGGNPAADASQFLRQQGVPGLKYFDQGSRNAGTGTSNYVMFDDKLISILRKYGILAPLAASQAPQDSPLQKALK